MTTPDQWRADFHQHYRDALVAICADADARMVASPPECRRIRLAAEQALATLPQDIQPCASWPADKQAAFARVARRTHRCPGDDQGKPAARPPGGQPVTLDPVVALQNAEQTIASIEPVRATYTAAIEQARNLLEIHGPDDPIVTRAFKLVEGRRQELAQIEKIATLRNHQASMLIGGYVDAVRMVAARMPLGEP